MCRERKEEKIIDKRLGDIQDMVSKSKYMELERGKREWERSNI